MGIYNFSWAHPAEEVYVTGTFDDWAKTVKLEKNGSVFEKTVTLPESDEKILYKFVADGVWQHDSTAKSEEDDKGNTNNVLYPADIKAATTAHSTISTVTPAATTLGLAGEQPLTKDLNVAPPPGAFPEESAEQTLSINPIPASEGSGNPIHLAPGEPVPHPSTINNNTVSSTVHDDPELLANTKEAEQTFSVAPIPATGGTGNPIHLAPGEPVPDPSTITSNTVDSTVKLDEASYNKSDATVAAAPPTSTTTSGDLAAAAVLGLGPQTSSLIPESSIGMGNDVPAPLEGAALSSVGAGSTTNALAGQVPLEPRGVPEVVSESQEAANASPEAAANPEAVAEKKEVEEELKQKVPEEPATTDKNENTLAAAVAGGVAGLGVAAASAAAFLRQKTTEATGTDPVSILPQTVQDQVNGTAERETATTVPAEVTESIQEAGVSPEAAANPVAVKEKSAVEQELLAKTEESQAAGEPAPVLAAATAETAPAATAAAATGASTTAASAVPEEVVESQKEAGVSPEASANPVTVEEKSATEAELLSKVKEVQPTASTSSAPQVSASGAPQLADPVGAGLAPITLDPTPAASSGLNAPATSQAQVQESRDVSPMTSSAAVGSTANQTAPVVTTGVGSATAPTTSTPVGTPRKGDSNSASGKRNSFMERLRGTPESTPSSSKDASSTKKKGFLSKLKEKFKS